MESQINAHLKTAHGTKIITIFGYSTKSLPGLEITGLGKEARIIKEKIIYITRMRKLSIPSRRYVICIDANSIKDEIGIDNLKWAEFPIMLLFWHMAGLIPMSRLEDCISSGQVKAEGEIVHYAADEDFHQELSKRFSAIEKRTLKYITRGDLAPKEMWAIDSSLLLEHIPNLKFV